MGKRYKPTSTRRRRSNPKADKRPLPANRRWYDRINWTSVINTAINAGAFVFAFLFKR